MTVNEKLAALRVAMKKEGIQALVVVDSDEHMSEYLPDHYKERRFVSGFTGSAGIVAITMDKSGLWTDGRYYIQAEKQLADSEIELFKAADVGVMSMENFLAASLQEGETIGMNGKLMSVKQLENIVEKCDGKGIKIRTDLNLVGDIWVEDRPQLPSAPAMLHLEEYCGKSAAAKIAEVRTLMNGKGLDYFVISALDSVNWLMNIRGNDVSVSPLFTSFAVIGTEEVYLYADIERLPDNVMEYLAKNGVTLQSYNDIYAHTGNMPARSRVGMDPVSLNAAIYELLGDRVDRVCMADFCQKLKAIKNTTEINRLRVTHKHDGIAMVRFLIWLQANIGTGKLTECSISDKLLELRAAQPGNKGISFETIAAYEGNAAMMHYSPSMQKPVALSENGLLLVDSGGQYLGGTTDITRTIALGKISASQRKDFTLVLRSFIDLSSVSFLEGSTGKSLDILARRVMWDNNLNYKCGTGHGVGFYLNVHEGPHNFGNAQVALEDGMVITIEPGIYITGRYGIRTENTVLVVKDRKAPEYGQFFRFEPLTMCPIDTSCVDVSMLDKKEIDWINSYHLSVFEKLSPMLEPDEIKWLGNATQPIHA